MRLLPVLLVTIALLVLGATSVPATAEPVTTEGTASQFTGKGSYQAFLEANKFYNQANALGRSGKYDEAIAAYLRAIAIYPYDASTYNNLGVTYGIKNNLKLAEDAFKHSIALRPTWDTWSHLAEVYEDQGRVREYRDAVARSLQLDPPPEARAQLEKKLARLDARLRQR